MMRLADRTDGDTLFQYDDVAVCPPDHDPKDSSKTWR